MKFSKKFLHKKQIRLTIYSGQIQRHNFKNDFNILTVTNRINMSANTTSNGKSNHSKYSSSISIYL